jgi:hypothetical protein
MKFLPSEKIIYKTKLTETEVLKRLSEHIEPVKAFRVTLFSNDATKPYQGLVKGLSFEITRIIRYRNSFLPIIVGVIEKNYDGTTINVQMRLHRFVLIFLCIWMIPMGGFAIMMLIAVLKGSEWNGISFMPLGMVLFAYALTIGGFNFESSKSKKDLQAIFEADIIDA